MSQLNEPSVDFHLKLNEQSFHIPNELLKKNVRQVNKLVELEAKKLNTLFTELDSIMSTHDNASSLGKLNEIIKAVEVLERKLEKRVAFEVELLNRIECRINYFKELDDLKNAEDADGLIMWYQRYTNLLVGDYLTRNGILYDAELQDKKEEAQQQPGKENNRQKRRLSSPASSSPPPNSGVQFLKQQNLENLLDYDILLTANKISKSLTNKHALSPLFSWIKENHSYLESKSSNLEFETRFQEYIELVKVQDYKNAIKCFQTHLVKFSDSNFEELKLASGLLVFIKNCLLTIPKKAKMDASTQGDKEVSKPRTREGFFSFFFKHQPPRSSGSSFAVTLEDLKKKEFSNNVELDRYSRVLDDSRWTSLKDIFLYEYFSMYGISHHDPLLIYLSLGISTLKTKACLQHPNTENSDNLQMDLFLNKEVVHTSCPVCSDEFSPIARDLPFSHHIQSSLFENPVMLPNGNIYDSRKLKALASTLNDKNLCQLNENQIMDPIDKKIYACSDFITMYPT
ncbi:LAMI_0E04082g1_1 [Lachancea mirantina]|uniref:LAMI_0E04082g1_1 n=1 Tax=Lachancea mirantina TaxID=1230905 RepID=A0A1G4JK47_9SACH|nr:LAMI_0E04082g1_1 [Lachancea mirantina]